MTETVRSVTELLDVLFASNQAPRSITEQDVRDAIVSISLETADFSDLPRSGVALPIGRCWIDATTALRVVLDFNPGVVSTAQMAGGGGLFARGVVGGVSNAWPANAQLGGAGALRATPIQFFVQFARATFGGGGSLLASPMQKFLGASVLNAAPTFTSDASITGQPPPNAFTADFSADFGEGASGSVARAANATIGGVGGVIATPQRGGAIGWDASRTSIYISLVSGQFSGEFTAAFNQAQTAVKTGRDGWYGGVVAAPLKSSGKWYWEYRIGAKAGDTGVGLANAVWAVDDSDPAFGSYLGSDTNSIGLYNGGSSGYTNNGDGSGGISPMPNVVANGNVGFALDCVNWKWWARQDGGAWNAGQAGAQDPATNQGGILIGASYRTGGIGPAITLQTLNDSVIAYFNSSSWSYVAPSGFAAP